MRVFGLALVSATIVFAGTSVGAAAASHSGIVGIVRFAPTCLPVNRTCSREQPVVTIRVSQPRTGKLVVTVRPGRQGRFRITLPSGRYLLEGVSNSEDTVFARRLVRVRAHALTLVLLTGSNPVR